MNQNDIKALLLLYGQAQEDVEQMLMSLRYPEVAW